jgi:hypothetical protein
MYNILKTYQDFLKKNFLQVMHAAPEETMNPCFFTLEDGVPQLLLITKCSSKFYDDLLQVSDTEILSSTWFIRNDEDLLAFGVVVGDSSIECEIYPDEVNEFIYNLYSTQYVTLAMIDQYSLELVHVNYKLDFTAAKNSLFVSDGQSRVH